MTTPVAGGENRLSPSSIEALVERLRDAKLPFGPSEVLDATRLLVRLGETGSGPVGVAELKPYLRPVFCKRAEDQRIFDEAFKLWLENRTIVPPPRPPHPSVLPPDPGTTPNRTNVPALIVASLLVLLAFGVGFYEYVHRGSTKPIAASGKGTGTAEPVMPAPAPSADVEQPPPAKLGVEERYFPAVRQNHELRPAWVLGGLLLSLSPFLFVRLPAAMLARRRSRSGRRVQLDTRRLESEARKLVPAVHGEAAARLSRHIRGRAVDPRRLARRPAIDVRRTVEATARRLGVPTLRYRHAPLRPSYLMLIDGDIEKDPRARLFYEWTRRLMNEGWDVEIRGFRRAPTGSPDDAPRVYRIETSGWSESRAANSPLDHLEDPPVGQRLLVLSDGDCLADEKGQPLPWVTRARFKRWRDRVVFTPVQMRHWGERESGIERRESPADPGFLVLPLDEPALDAWALFLATGRLTGFTLSEPERYPHLLANRDVEARDPKRPFPQLDALVTELKLYLGDTGFRWLAALAVPPLVRWELTVLIGTSLIDSQVARTVAVSAARSSASRALLVSLNYRRLAQLPWLRTTAHADGEVEPGMPDWLRLRLLHELPARAAEQVREAVRNALASAAPRPGRAGLELELELPPSNGDLPPKRGDGNESVDTLYLGYMSGLSARELQLRAPEGWSSWVESLQLRRRRGIAHALRGIAERLEAFWARRAFRGGIAPAGLAREWGIAVVVGFTVWLAAVVVLVVLVLSDSVPVWLEGALFVDRARGVGLTDFPPADVRFSGDGKQLFVMDQDGTAHLFDTANGRETKTWRGPAYAANAEFSLDGSRVMTWCAESVDVWDTKSGTKLAWIHSERSISHAVMSEDGARIAVASGLTMSLWNAATGAAITSHDDSSPIKALAIDGGGAHVAWISDTSPGTVFDVAKKRTTLAEHPTDSDRARLQADGSATVAFGPRGETVIFGVVGEWTLMQTPTGDAPGAFDWFPRQTGDDCVALSSRRIATASGSKVSVWGGNGDSGGSTNSLDLDAGGEVRALAFNPDGTSLTAMSTSGLRAWDATSGAPISELRIADASAFWIGPDGSLATISTVEPFVRLWFRATRDGNGAWSTDPAVGALVPDDPEHAATPSVAPDRPRAWLIWVCSFVFDHPWSVPIALAAGVAITLLADGILLRRWLLRQAHG